MRRFLFVFFAFLLTATSILAPAPDWLAKVGIVGAGGELGGLQTAEASGDILPVTIGKAETPPIAFSENDTHVIVNNWQFMFAYAKESGIDQIYTPFGELLSDSSSYQFQVDDLKYDLSGPIEYREINAYEYEVIRTCKVEDYGAVKLIWNIRAEDRNKLTIDFKNGPKAINVAFNWLSDISSNEYIETDSRITFVKDGTELAFDWSDAAKFDTSSAVSAKSEQVKGSEITFNLGTVKPNQRVVIDPSTVGTSTSSYAVSFPNQRVVYSASRFWLIYSDGTGLVAQSSADGITWSSTEDIISGSPFSRSVSVWFDGTNICLVYVEDGSTALRNDYYITGDVIGTTFYGINWRTQSFTPAFDYTLTKVKLKLYRSGSPGNVTVSIRATDGTGKPTGADLVSENTDGNTLATGSPYTWREISFGAGTAVTAGTKYAIVVRALSGSIMNSAGWRYNGSSPTYVGGSYGSSSNSGSTWSMATYNDFMFETWGVGENLIYREYTPNDDGTLTPLAGHDHWEVAIAQAASSSFSRPFVCKDSSGYPVIAYVFDNGTTKTPYVTKSNQNDGTWTSCNFTTQLSTDNSALWAPTVLPLGSQDLMAIYAKDGATIKSKVYDYSALAFLSENATTSAIEVGSYFSAVVTSDNVCHMVFLGDTSENITYTHYHSGGTAWQTEEVVYAAASATSAPVLSKTLDDNLYCFWMGDPTADHIYYKAQFSGTWDTDPTDWLTESNITNNASISCVYEQTTSDYLGACWLTGASSPYNVRFAGMERDLSPTNWLEGYSSRALVTSTERGGGAKAYYTSQFEAFYSGCAMESDGCTQFINRPAFRYVGTHDRTYMMNAASTGLVTIRYWDEDDKVLSDPTSLHTCVDGKDHNGGCTIVLQHQTGAKSGENGTVLCVYANYTGAVTYSRRSDSAEDISTFGAAVNSGMGAAYPMVCETSDGSIWAVSQRGGIDNPLVTLKIDAADPDSDTWSARIPLVDLTAGLGTYTRIWLDEDTDEIHCASSWYDIPTTGYYQDVYYFKIVVSADDASTATSTTANKLVDSTADFVTLGVAADWRVYNKTDNTHARVTAVNDLNTLSLDANIMADDEEYVFYHLENAAGTLKHFPLDLSAAPHTPDLVYESQADEYDTMWDVMTDASHNPFIVYQHSVVKTAYYAADIMYAYYNAGWTVEDTGVNTCTFGESPSRNVAGMGIDPNDVTRIVAAVPDGSNIPQIQVYKRSTTPPTAGSWALDTTWAGDGKITQASPGANFRPFFVINGAGFFRLLWFYTERYPYAVGYAMSMAYPGFSNQNFICVNKQCRTDFGDIRFTTSDGSTLANNADGAPFIEASTSSWRAILWERLGNIPAAAGSLSNYVYWGNASAANPASGYTAKQTMQANFKTTAGASALADDFLDGALDAAVWDEMATTVDWTPSDYVKITTDGQIRTDATYAVGYELRINAWVHLDSLNMEWYEDANNDMAIAGPVFDAADTAGQYISYEDLVSTGWTAYTSLNSYEKYHSYAIQRVSSTVAYFKHIFPVGYGAGWTSAAIGDANIPNGNCYVRISTSDAVNPAVEARIDWVFVRPITDPEPKLTVSGQIELLDLSVTPATWTTFYKEGAASGVSTLQMNSWYTSDNDSNKDYFTLTNNSYSAFDVLISSGDNWTGTGVVWHVSPTGSPGDHTIGLWAGITPVGYIASPSGSFTVGFSTQSRFYIGTTGEGTTFIGFGATGFQSSSSGDYDILIKPDDPANFLVENLAASATQDFGLLIWTCTSNGGNAVMTGTVTLTATVHT